MSLHAVTEFVILVPLERIFGDFVMCVGSAACAATSRYWLTRKTGRGPRDRR